MSACLFSHWFIHTLILKHEHESYYRENAIIFLIQYFSVLEGTTFLFIFFLNLCAIRGHALGFSSVIDRIFPQNSLRVYTPYLYA